MTDQILIAYRAVCDEAEKAYDAHQSREMLDRMYQRVVGAWEMVLAITTECPERPSEWRKRVAGTFAGRVA